MATRQERRQIQEQINQASTAVQGLYQQRGLRYDAPTGRAVPINTSTPNIPSSITSSDLSPTPSISAVNVKPSTQSTSLFESLAPSVDQINTQAEQFAKSQAPVNETTRANVDEAGKTIFNRLFKRKGKETLTSEKYASDVDPAKSEVDTIQEEIRNKSLAYRRQIERIQNNAEGLTRAGVAGRVSEIERAGNRELADLSIIEQAKLQRYDTAKAIADRAINAELEQDKNEIDAMQFWYSENKEALNKQEDRQFNLMINERERLLKEQATDKKTITDLVLDAVQNGLPASAAQQALRANNVEEIISTVGPYVGRLDRLYRQKQLDYLDARIAEKNSDLASGNLTDTEVKAIDTSPQAKKIVALSDLKTSANAYQALVQQYGTELAGTGKTLLENAYAELQVKWKEAANLGALTGPDLQLIQDSVKPATGLRGVQTNITGGGSSGILSGLTQMINKIDSDAAQSYIELLSRNNKYKDSSYVNSLSLPFLAQYRSQVKPGELLVRSIITGQIGKIPEAEFSSDKYQKL